MKDFLHKKGVDLSLKTYFITALSFMALGLFSSLIIGLIIRTTGQQMVNISWLVPVGKFAIEMGELAMGLMGPAIGVAVAYGLRAPRLVLFPAVVTGAAGAALGGPAGAFIAAILSTEIGKLVSKETRLDIIVTPFVTILAGYTVATTIGPVIAGGIEYFGALIMWSVDLQPFLMGILVALFMGLALTAPISSAAIAFMLGLEGIAAGAATVGCAAQMIGFATSSYRENGFSGFIALGIGTSMLQVPNIIKNPFILLPPTIAGMILAPFATIVFQMVNNPAGAGMGTSGFVGQIMTFTVMGFTWDIFLKVILLHFIGPAMISLILSEALRKAGIIKLGDMKIEQ